MATAPSGYAVILWVLTGLLFLRVLGQALVAFFALRLLPPMAEWCSGLLPYPILSPLRARLPTRRPPTPRRRALVPA